MDERTVHLNLPLPHPEHLLVEDVGRLREALSTLDGAVADKADAGDVLSLLAQEASTRLMLEVVTLSYDERAMLRERPAVTGQRALIDGLGLFGFVGDSQEPDDDESCFATSNGRWLLQAPSWDLIDAWLEAQADADRPIFAHAKCSISSINATASAKFSVLVPGAKVGDVVSVTPPAEIGDGSQNSGRLSFYGFVSAPDTVTIQLSNPSAATAVINPAARADWIISIWKER